MGNFRHDLDLLQKRVVNKFTELRDANPRIEFLTQEDVVNGDYEEYLDARNSINGETYEICVIGIDEQGIEVYKVDSGSIRHISFNDLASLEDKISLVELMEVKIKEL